MEVILYVDIYEWNLTYINGIGIETIMLDEISIISSSVYEIQRTSTLHVHVLFLGDFNEMQSID